MVKQASVVQLFPFLLPLVFAQKESCATISLLPVDDSEKPISQPNSQQAVKMAAKGLKTHLCKIVNTKNTNSTGQNCIFLIMKTLFLMLFTLCCFSSPGAFLFDHNRLLALQNSTGTSQCSLEKQRSAHIGLQVLRSAFSAVKHSPCAGPSCICSCL